MTAKEIFIHAVQSSSQVPDLLREYADHISALQETQFDQTLMDLLELQARQSSRGPQWAKTLERRRQAMLPYCGQRLLKGRIDIGIDAYWLLVDPETADVVYYECYEAWHEQII